MQSMIYSTNGYVGLYPRNFFVKRNARPHSSVRFNQQNHLAGAGVGLLLLQIRKSEILKYLSILTVGPDRLINQARSFPDHKLEMHMLLTLIFCAQNLT